MSTDAPIIRGASCRASRRPTGGSVSGPQFPASGSAIAVPCSSFRGMIALRLADFAEVAGEGSRYWLIMMGPGRSMGVSFGKTSAGCAPVCPGH